MAKILAFGEADKENNCASNDAGLRLSNVAVETLNLISAGFCRWPDIARQYAQLMIWPEESREKPAEVFKK
jgi:hypothetical protein